MAAPEPAQKSVTPAVATAPKAVPSKPQPVSAAVSKPPAAVVASAAAGPSQPQTAAAAAAVPKPATRTPAAPKTTTAPTAVSPRSQPVSAAGPKPSAAVVASPTSAAASPTATKPAASNTASVTTQSGPSGIPPAVVRLAEIAKTDPQLRALIEKVGSKEGTKEDEERLTSIVDRIAAELSSSGEAVAATVQSLRPSSAKSDAKNPTARAESSGAPASRPSPKEGKKGPGLGLKSPESSKPPTPQLAKATIPSTATPTPLVTAGPTPESSKANSRTSSPTEAPTSTTTLINIPAAAAAAKPATFVKPEQGVATAPAPAAAKTGQPPNNEKFEVTIGKGSWNVETSEPWGDDRTVRLIACSQTKIASTAPGQEYQYCPYKFDIDPMNFADAVVENSPSTSPNANAKTIVTIVLKKELEGSGGEDRKVVLTFDRFVNPDTNAVESGRVQARRFCRWLRGVNTSIAYSNKRFVAWYPRPVLLTVANIDRFF